MQRRPLVGGGGERPTAEAPAGAPFQRGRNPPPPPVFPAPALPPKSPTQRKPSDDLSSRPPLPLHHGATGAARDGWLGRLWRYRGGSRARLLLFGAFVMAALNVVFVLRLGTLDPVLRLLGWQGGSDAEAEASTTPSEDDTPQQAAARADAQLEHGAPSDAFCTGARLRGWDAPPAPAVCAHGTYDGVEEAAKAQPNTLAAYRQALAAGVTCVEVDAARTLDGELLVLHARDLGRYLPPGEQRRQVCDFASHEIAALTSTEAAAQRGLPPLDVASVHDALSASLEGGATRAIVDLKVCERDGMEVDTRELVRDVVLTMKRVGCGKRCLVWAKSDEAVARTKSLDDLTLTGYVVMNHTASSAATGHDATIRGTALPEHRENERGLDWTQLGRAEVVAMYYGTLDADRLDVAHRHGKEVYAWVANDAPSMVKCLDHFVDGVVTNHPARLLRARQARYAACRSRYHVSAPPPPVS